MLLVLRAPVTPFAGSHLDGGILQHEGNPALRVVVVQGQVPCTRLEHPQQCCHHQGAAQHQHCHDAAWRHASLLDQVVGDAVGGCIDLRQRDSSRRGVPVWEQHWRLSAFALVLTAKLLLV